MKNSTTLKKSTIKRKAKTRKIDLVIESKEVENTDRTWLTLEGDSMTSEAGLSIPSGSKMLIKRINYIDPLRWPIRQPVVIKGVFQNKPFLVCKNITFIDEVSGRIKCENLNPSHDPFWLENSLIDQIFIVEEFEFSGKRTKIPDSPHNVKFQTPTQY